MSKMKGTSFLFLGIGVAIAAQLASAGGLESPGACKPITKFAPPPAACKPVQPLPPPKACEPVKGCDSGHSHLTLHSVSHHLDKAVHAVFHPFHEVYYTGTGKGDVAPESAPPAAAPATPAAPPAPPAPKAANS